MKPKKSQDFEPQIIYKWSIASRSPLPRAAEHGSVPCSGVRVSAWAGECCLTHVPIDLHPQKGSQEPSGGTSGAIQGIQKPKVASSRAGEELKQSH